MKVVIDIPEIAYEAYKEWHKNKMATVEQSLIAHGTILPEGEWIKVKEYRMPIDMSGGIVTGYKCSECGRMISTLPSKLANYPFCHCGAYMGKKEMRKND